MFIIKYLKSFMYILISLLLLSILIGTLSYFDVLRNSSIKIFELIAIIISMLIGGIYLGKNSNKKGYLEGIKIGLAMIVILFIFGYLSFGKEVSISTLIFYVIILVSSVLGSIFGINKKGSNS